MALAFNGKGGGGTAFNGGTITQELIVNTGSGSGQALELQGTSTTTQDVFRIDYPHTALEIDSGGGFQMSSDSSVTLAVFGTGAAATAEVNIADARAATVTLDLSTSGGLSVHQVGAGHANIIITDLDSNELFAAGSDIGGGIKTSPQRSGALPTTTFVSGTGKQISTGRDRNMVVPFTGDATNNAATLLIQLSPDDVTYSTLDTLSIAAALNLTGAINTPVSLYVPAGWYVKLTATHGTIGTGTYY